jgi:hypothetical protein
MSPPNTIPARFIGLDIHKHYIVAVGVSSQQEQIFGPQRIPINRNSSPIPADTPASSIRIEK